MNHGRKIMQEDLKPKRRAHNERHSQVWVKKNVSLNVNEVNQCTEDGCRMASQA